MEAANKWIPWSFLPEKRKYTVSSVLLPKPGQAEKKKGVEEGVPYYMKNPSSLGENILDTKFPQAPDAQLHIALQYHDCNFLSLSA